MAEIGGIVAVLLLVALGMGAAWPVLKSFLQDRAESRQRIRERLDRL